MSIIDDRRSSHNPHEHELAAEWEPESEGEAWEPDDLGNSIDWLPTDSWFDRQAELYESKGSDVADFAAAWFRDVAMQFRALDASTLDEYLDRVATYED